MSAAIRQFEMERDDLNTQTLSEQYEEYKTPEKAGTNILNHFVSLQSKTDEHLL